MEIRSCVSLIVYEKYALTAYSVSDIGFIGWHAPSRTSIGLIRETDLHWNYYRATISSQFVRFRSAASCQSFNSCLWFEPIAIRQSAVFLSVHAVSRKRKRRWLQLFPYRDVWLYARWRSVSRSMFARPFARPSKRAREGERERGSCSCLVSKMTEDTTACRRLRSKPMLERKPLDSKKKPRWRFYTCGNDKSCTGCSWFQNSHRAAHTAFRWHTIAAADDDDDGKVVGFTGEESGRWPREEWSSDHGSNGSAIAYCRTPVSRRPTILGQTNIHRDVFGRFLLE